MDQPRIPKCMKCKIPMNVWECATACAIAEKNNGRAFYICGMCGAKHQIYAVTEYRVLKLIKAPAQQAAVSEDK